MLGGAGSYWLISLFWAVDQLNKILDVLGVYEPVAPTSPHGLC